MGCGMDWYPSHFSFAARSLYAPWTSISPVGRKFTVLLFKGRHLPAIPLPHLRGIWAQSIRPFTSLLSVLSLLLSLSLLKAISIDPFQDGSHHSHAVQVPLPPTPPPRHSRLCGSSRGPLTGHISLQSPHPLPYAYPSPPSRQAWSMSRPARNASSRDAPRSKKRMPGCRIRCPGDSGRRHRWRS